MKVKELENFMNKRGLMGCNWPILNAPGTETPLSHSVLKLEEFPFSIWGNKELAIGCVIRLWPLKEGVAQL